MSKKIYINPGHSEKDPGAVAYETERKLNVKVSDFMNKYLLENYDCETRIYSNDSLNAVCNDANKWGADLFVSNHFNAGGGDGYEALVYSQNRVPLGEIFAKHVQAIGQNLRLYGAAPGVKIRTNLHVLKYTNMAAVLNEGAFVDNQKDIADWNEDHELQKLGEAYAKAAAEYLGLSAKVAKEPESAPVVSEKTDSVRLPQLSKGAKGDTVKALQILLIGRGYSCGSYGADASFGSATDSAVKKFQKAKGLSVDGVVGPATWAKLLGV